MRRSLFLLSSSFVFLLAACSDGIESPTAGSFQSAIAPQLQVQSAERYVPGRVLVSFEPGAPVADIVSSQGASIEGPVGVDALVLAVPQGREAAVVAALQASPNVRFAELDLVRTFGDPTVVTVDDPFFGHKWDLDNDGSVYSSEGGVLASTGSADADMDWLEFWNENGQVTGSAVIGILDTGIRYDHEEVTGRIAASWDFFAGDSDASDDYGHGTHVAGIAAASTNNGTGVSGVAAATDVRFAIAKVCGRSNPGPFGYGCPTSAIADGIVWGVDNGANVLNLSLGGGSGSETTRQALQYARSNDVLPFCAAGNDGSGSVSYPAAWPECVAVSSTDWSDGLASYSNWGPEVELSAPGGDDEHADGYSYILSSYYEGTSSYAFMAGTSMASPQAAGLGALLHALGTTDDDSKLGTMKSSADDLGASGADEKFGAGRINVYNAVNGLGGDSGETDGGTTNSAPAASFTYSCTDLDCDFDGTGSSDSDGTITSHEWDFGDGSTATGSTTSHSYAAGGTYTVTLTVSDDEGATDTTIENVSVTEPVADGFSLSATGYKVRGRHHVDLSWSGATSAEVDVYRDGGFLTTTADDGAYTDATDNRGGATYSYQVCEAGTTTCSNEATVIF